MSDLPTLHLPMCAKYFDQVASGEKLDEYRLYTRYWMKRIEGREFEDIVLTRGYPKRDDKTRRMICEWRGYSIITICHEHFGDVDKLVFAIDVSEIIEPPEKSNE